MPSSRRKLIEGSSFLWGEREKLGGGMSSKRSIITAESFKKGSSSLETRVSNNERKITLLKNIISTPKGMEGFKSLDTQTESFGQIISDIREAVGGILITLTLQKKADKKGARKERIRQEQDKRSKIEDDLETDRFTGVKAITKKVLAPVATLWERIFKFLKLIFFGRVLFKLLEWFGDPKNSKKIESFIKFTTNFWPAIVAGALLFGTSLGRMITGLVARSIVAIPGIKAIGVALAAFAAANPWLVALVGGASVAGIYAAATRNRGKNFAEGGFVSGPSGVDRVPANLTAGEFVMSKGAVEKYGADTLAGMNAAAGGTNRPRGGRYNTGGVVGRHSQEEFDMMTANYKANPTSLGATQLNRYARRLKAQNQAEFGGTGEAFTFGDKTYQPGDEGYLEAINAAQSIMHGQLSELKTANEQGGPQGSPGGDGADGPPGVPGASFIGGGIDWKGLSELTKDMPDPVTPTMGQGNVKEAQELRGNFNKRLQLADEKTDLLRERGFDINAPVNIPTTQVINNLNPQGVQGNVTPSAAPVVPPFEAGVMRSTQKIKTLGILAL